MIGMCFSGEVHEEERMCGGSIRDVLQWGSGLGGEVGMQADWGCAFSGEVEAEERMGGRPIGAVLQ